MPYNFKPSTLFIGKKIIFLPSCHSTNDELVKMIPETGGDSTLEGTVVVTDQQTAGRGQRGNRWEAEPGQNLTFSLLLKPTFLQASAQFDLSIAIALGVYEALGEHLDENQLRIKWPNDLYHLHPAEGNQKLGGLLIENTLQGYQVSTAIVGIGLNINQLIFPVPQATSLRRITGQPFSYDLERLLARLLECLEAEYLRLRQGGQQAQKARYLARLFRYQEWHPYRSNGRLFNAQLLGVDETGCLALETTGGLRYFGIKEVEFVI
ncbi:MAG: biotin--[acetyl-CoA-carboxylase] ligase [Cytophagaceae bacterium]|nr:biotin--[acetyl-CoA-carboxylase] ligase [Cytophagaceae bacterium]